MAAVDPLEERIVEIRKRDRRFSRQAYEFILEALDHTIAVMGKDRLTGEERHVGGRELLLGIKDFASKRFGPMAPFVFRQWGVRRTDDFGEIVFNLIDAGLLSRRDSDSRLDFQDGFDFDRVFDEAFRDHLSELGSS
ncbi:MAG: Minf_1886 family protein [Planctomycetota bacterium]